ncbi:MAG: hypothetical protein M9894_25215 [Planctomycetes bacterium]|nr:hypothetical protein [Planctomycetota bacterium]
MPVEAAGAQGRELGEAGARLAQGPGAVAAELGEREVEAGELGQERVRPRRVAPVQEAPGAAAAVRGGEAAGGVGEEERKPGAVVEARVVAQAGGGREGVGAVGGREALEVDAAAAQGEVGLARARLEGADEVRVERRGGVERPRRRRDGGRVEGAPREGVLDLGVGRERQPDELPQGRPEGQARQGRDAGVAVVVLEEEDEVACAVGPALDEPGGQGAHEARGRRPRGERRALEEVAQGEHVGRREGAAEEVVVARGRLAERRPEGGVEQVGGAPVGRDQVAPGAPREVEVADAAGERQGRPGGAAARGRRVEDEVLGREEEAARLEERGRVGAEVGREEQPRRLEGVEGPPEEGRLRGGAGCERPERGEEVGVRRQHGRRPGRSGRW